MTILEQIEQRSSALRVNEFAEMLQVTPQHIDLLASASLIPCFRIEGAIHLDPQEVAAWLRSRQPPVAAWAGLSILLRTRAKKRGKWTPGWTPWR